MLNMTIRGIIDRSALAAGCTASISECWLAYGEVTLRHAAGVTLQAAHAAAATVAGVRIVETLRLAPGGTIVSRGTVLAS